MDWLGRSKNYKGLYGILQLLQGSHLDNFPPKTLKLGWVAFHSLTIQLKCLDFQSNQYKKLAPVLSRFCNGLLRPRLQLWPYVLAGSICLKTNYVCLDKKLLFYKNVTCYMCLEFKIQI